MSKYIALTIVAVLLVFAGYLLAEDPVIPDVVTEQKVVFVQEQPDKPAQTYVVTQNGEMRAITKVIPNTENP